MVKNDQITMLWLRTAGALRRTGRGQRGASLVEYALLVALIAIVCFVAVMLFGTEARDSFSRTGASVQAT